MTDEQRLAYIKKVSALGSSYGLDTMREFLQRLNNPQDALQFIHIAGTNGKGSILAYASTTLALAGYKTGRYVSPSVFTYRERIQINGEFISDDDLTKYFMLIEPVCNSMVSDGFSHPTIFEIELAISLLYFRDEKCDIVVLETGLGGRLDATNIIQDPLVCAIASISFDHTALLGNTLTAIATEKAGIVKEGATVVLSPEQDDEVLAVFEKATAEKNAPLIYIDKKDIIPVSDTIDGQVFRYKGVEYQIGLLGPHQLNNAACAIELLQIVSQKGLPLTLEQIKYGLLHTKWHGRFERIATKPDFIIDGAHNPDAALRLAQSLDQYFPNKKIIFIMVIFQDKDFRKIIEITAHKANHIIATTSGAERALTPDALKDELAPYHSHITVCADLADAVRLAQKIATEDDVIVAFGSLSHLGKVYETVIQSKGDSL